MSPLDKGTRGTLLASHPGMNAKELCNRQVVIASPELSVLDAARRMREHHVGDLIVVEEGDDGNEPVGVVTDRDLVLEVLADNVHRAEAMQVGEVMTCEIVTAGEDEDVAAVLQKMRSSGVRRIPVVNSRGALEGILTYDDLLEWFVEELRGLVAVIEVGRRTEVQRSALTVTEQVPAPHIPRH